MAVTVEFMLRFTGAERRQFARGFQIAVLVLPLVSLVGLQPSTKCFPSAPKSSSAG